MSLHRGPHFVAPPSVRRQPRPRLRAGSESGLDLFTLLSEMGLRLVSRGKAPLHGGPIPKLPLSEPQQPRYPREFAEIPSPRLESQQLRQLRARPEPGLDPVSRAPFNAPSRGSFQSPSLIIVFPSIPTNGRSRSGPPRPASTD